MHVILFGVKRAFHAPLKVFNRALEPYGLTCARFDALYGIARAGYRRWQSDLWKRLGVSRATVSRMLRALEELGLVARRWDPNNRRQKIVQLTDAGAKALRRARGYSLSRCVDLAFDSVLAPHEWMDEGAVLRALDVCNSQLDRLRRGFADRATLQYPGLPDD
jgi:DNA-binding MarR family transcriptional regulator